MTVLVRHLILIIALLFAVIFGRGQETTHTELYQVLKEKDSILFDAAFNRCDTDTMAGLFTKDFEFYHDKVGATIGRESFLEPTIAGCDSRDSEAPQPAKRFLIDDSLEVYPLYNDGVLYGAIQHGIHRFEFLNNQGEYQRGDTARFTHLWVLQDNDWKIKRELSYDHQAYAENQTN